MTVKKKKKKTEVVKRNDIFDKTMKGLIFNFEKWTPILGPTNNNKLDY